MFKFYQVHLHVFIMEFSYIANILLPILKYYVALATCNNKLYIPFFKLEFLNFYLYLENYLLSE